VEDDEDEVQEERPRARRTRDEEDERPAPRRRPAREEDDEEEERPRPRFRKSGDAPERKRPASAGGSSLKSGWGSGKMKSRDFDKEKFTVDEDTTYVFRFAEEAPIASWNEHFLNKLPKGTRKSYVCAEDACPICEYLDDVGAKDGHAGFRRAFNVIVFDKKGNPEVKYWVATPAVISEIERFAFDEEWTEPHGPLNNPKTYFKVSKARPNKDAPFKYRIEFIRSRDLEEERKIVPLSADELEELADDFFTQKDVVKLDSLDTLDEVVEELS
jgi:hypothetical protein